MNRYGDYEDVQIQSEEDVYIRIQIVRARNRSSQTPLLIYIKRPTDNLSFVDIDELLPVLGHCDLAMLNPRLTDHPIDHQLWTDIERTAAWSGRTIAAMQVWDVHRSIEWLQQKLSSGKRPIILFAKEDMTIPALYAAVLHPDVTQLIVRDLPVSHRQAPPLLNVLRYTDIPEVAAAFAPRRLTSLGSSTNGFNRTQKIYSLQEALNFTSFTSVAEALFKQ